MNKTPCKDCVPPKRHIGCHGVCEEYKQAKEWHDTTIEQYRKSISGKQAAWAVRRDGVDRNMRKGRNKKKKRSI